MMRASLPASAVGITSQSQPPAGYLRLVTIFVSTAATMTSPNANCPSQGSREPKQHRAGSVAYRRRLPVSDLCAIEGLWDAVHLAWRISVVDQPIPAPGQRVSEDGSDPAKLRPGACDRHLIRGGLCGIGDWLSSRAWNLGEGRERVRLRLHASLVLCFQLSGRQRTFVAILRSVPGSFGSGTLLSGLHCREE